MRRIAALLVLLVPATVRANAGSPGMRTLWIDYTFTIEPEHADYEFYLLWPDDREPAEKLPLSPGNPVRVSGDVYRYTALLYAVRKSLLAPFQGSPPPRSWFRENEGRGVERVQGLKYSSLDFREAVWFTDNRQRAEITCRIDVEPDGVKLVVVSENRGDPWVRWGWIVGGALAMAGVTGLGFRWIRRICCGHSVPT